MGKIGIWKVHPIKNEIILTLIRHQGEMVDADLLRSLQNQYNDITKNMLNRLIFDLEVEMVLHVTKIKKGQYRLALNPYAPIDESLKKDMADSLKTTQMVSDNERNGN